MENTIAILIADLSGYTAMTEAHGAVTAADLIDKYISIVENCLVGDTKLHERTGDEIMIVSTSAEALLATAHLIAEKTFKEDNFLLIHGGLHVGSALKRGNSYFGSAINLTSRIAAQANAGTYWCSEQYVEALTDKSLVQMTPKGSHIFKNISKEQKVFELCMKDGRNFLIDPVCKMLILDPTNAFAHPDEAGLYFCSPACRETFLTKSVPSEASQPRP